MTASCRPVPPLCSDVKSAVRISLSTNEKKSHSPSCSDCAGTCTRTENRVEGSTSFTAKNNVSTRSGMKRDCHRQKSHNNEGLDPCWTCLLFHSSSGIVNPFQGHQNPVFSSCSQSKSKCMYILKTIVVGDTDSAIVDDSACGCQPTRGETEGIR
jgi:hypothetical protein